LQENGEVKEKTPKKKVSQLERTRAEAEALIGDLKKDGAESGGRRTRSQTRGTPAKSVVPEKPVRTPRTPKTKSESPAAAPKKTPAAGRSRGRPAKKAAAPADEENGASAAAGDAADTETDAAADVKSDEVEKADPVVAENGQKSSDSQESSAETESKDNKKEAEPEAQKVVEKVAEPKPESVEKTADPSPATAPVTAE
jgi:hypothetical protein